MTETPTNDTGGKHTDTEVSESPRVLTAVSCGESKQNIAGLERVPARELYNSTVHKCKDKYGRHSHGYYIMSARHGLIHNQKEIGYYDELLDEKPESSIRHWGCEVTNSLEQAIEDGDYDAVVLIGSKTYVNAVTEYSKFLPVPVLTPWQTDDYVTGIGRGMAWSNDESNWPVNVDSIDEIEDPATTPEERPL